MVVCEKSHRRPTSHPTPVHKRTQRQACCIPRPRSAHKPADIDDKHIHGGSDDNEHNEGGDDYYYHTAIPSPPHLSVDEYYDHDEGSSEESDDDKHIHGGSEDNESGGHCDNS
jgi:hypothetical protein